MALSAIGLSNLSRAYSTIAPGLKEGATFSSRNLFLSKLENHLSEWKKGAPSTSQDVSYEVGREQFSTGSVLSYNSPKSLSAFSGYLTALPYSQRARFVSGTYQAATTLGSLNGSQTGGALNTLL